MLTKFTLQYCYPSCACVERKLVRKVKDIKGCRDMGPLYSTTKIVQGSRDCSTRGTRVSRLVTIVTEHPLLHPFDAGQTLHIGKQNNVTAMLHYISNLPYLSNLSYLTYPAPLHQ